MPLVYSMATEFLPPKRRGFYITLVAAWWMVGNIFAAGAAWVLMGHFDLHWKYFALAASAPAWLALVLAIPLLPETPRYLFMRGNLDGAVRVLGIMCKFNCKPALYSSGRELLEDIEDEKDDRHVSRIHGGHLQGEEGGEEVYPGLLEEQKRQEAAGLKGLGSPSLSEPEEGKRAKLFVKKGSWLSLFHPTLFRTTVLSMIIWFTLSFGWHVSLPLFSGSYYLRLKFFLFLYQ